MNAYRKLSTLRPLTLASALALAAFSAGCGSAASSDPASAPDGALTIPEAAKFHPAGDTARAITHLNFYHEDHFTGPARASVTWKKWQFHDDGTGRFTIALDNQAPTTSRDFRWNARDGRVLVAFDDTGERKSLTYANFQLRDGELDYFGTN